MSTFDFTSSPYNVLQGLSFPIQKISHFRHFVANNNQMEQDKFANVEGCYLL